MIKDEIGQLIEKTAVQLNLIIYEWSVLLKGANSKLAIKIDNPEQPVSHQDCENFSRALAEKLDESELLANYTLEVSSPGIKRKLRSIEELTRFIKSPVKIVYDDGNNRDTIKGIVREIEDDIIFIHSNEHKDVKIRYSDIITANLDY